ncbi:alpha-E domain-containing protein, partial [Salmonella enterica]|uniref:alpha-E domain-containing protein n=1 Tax=Salmonella enterica TaxID=28901 RepID=UPI0016540AD0
LEAPNSIVSCLAKARENARSVREVISSEMWEQVNRAYLMVMDAASSRTPLVAPHDFFTAVKQASQLFVGVTDLTMSH